MVPSPSPDYAGDISAAEAWEMLEARTQRPADRRAHHGGMELCRPARSVRLGRRVHCVEWQSFPTGAPNPGFVAEAEQAICADEGTTPVLLLCRSGARSRAAAIALTAAGFTPSLQYRGRL